MPLDVQWFIYVLVSNGSATVEDAVAVYSALGGNADLSAYAQSILESMANGLDEAQIQTLMSQIQELASYAIAQAETGSTPPLEMNLAAVPVPAPAQTAAAAPAPGVQEQTPPPAGGKRSELINEEAQVFPEVEIDTDSLHGYEDLPSFADTPNLNDEDLVIRMIYMLTALRFLGCSDVHISANSPPFVRRHLEIERIDSYVLTAEDAERINFCLLSAERIQRFRKDQDMNFSLEVGVNRFRVCLMVQKEGISGSYRLVPRDIVPLEQLGFLPRDAATIRRLLDYNNGLILVTGPIGAGKTTTLASMVDVLNEKRHDHVITVEEPIEILQLSKNCSVTQREVGKHTLSYHAALKGALREDPDVIVIGEMHDLETIENAITAAETGHLVIGTLHTGDAPNTLNQILDVFPPSQQAQIRAMTAGSLRGIICQKQIPNGMGGIELVYEIMINTMSVSNLVSEGKAYQLKATMAIGSKQGMFIMDQLVQEKYKAGLLTYEAALDQMRDMESIAQMEREHAIEEAKKLSKKK